MTEHLQILFKCKLFSQLDKNDIPSALKCLDATIKQYKKNSVIYFEGEQADFVGVILSGEVDAQSADFNGNVNIVSKLFAADVIALSVFYSTNKRVPFDFVCASDCIVMNLNVEKLIEPCQSSCPFHKKLVQNILHIIADRNIALAGKINMLSKRSIREKILAYLMSQSKRAGRENFCISLSRRQMAEYLSTNRSALSRELCNLRDEGLIEFDKNNFKLKKNHAD